jgi:alpha-L-fucosidase
MNLQKIIKKMNLQKTTKHLLVFSILLLSINTLMAQTKKEVKEKGMEDMWGDTSVSNVNLKLEKVKFFDQSNFGMFIHWGLFSNLGGVWDNKTYYGIGEWIMNPRMAGIPIADYKKVAKNFNPTGFDAKKIAQLAKDAGMKYIIITSKHHEGFAMFNSKASDFNIVKATPFGRDPMLELSKACHELGLGFGFYYSHFQDWTTPGGGNGPAIDEKGNEVAFKDYFYNKCKPQVKEICTNYGEIDFVWFDTPGDMKKEYVVELATMVRELQPSAMMCSRVGHGMGDYSSEGDMDIPTRNIKGLWETCDTNNDSWSYAWYDNNFKSPKVILHRLISTVARGGSYLFNVGPDSNGIVPEIGAEFLEQTGKWIQKYPQVIYGAGSSPWGYALPWGDVTTNGNSLFLSVFDWPKDGQLYLPGLESEIAAVKLVESSKNSDVKYKQKNGWTILDLPYKPLDSPVSVVEVVLKSPANQAKVETGLGVYPNIEKVYLTEFGETTNAEAKGVRWMEKFGEWKHVNQVSNWKENGKVKWNLNVQKPGYYYLDLNYKGTGRLVWKAVTDEGVKVQNQQAATEKYIFYNMGIVEFKTAGNHTIEVSLVEGDTKTSSLRAMKLKPIQ